MPISQMLLPEFDQEMAGTRKILERVPVDHLDFKPGAKSMTLGRLAWHVAELPMWSYMTMTTESLDMNPGDYVPRDSYTREELLQAFDKAAAEAREAIAAAPDEAFSVNWSLVVAGTPLLTLPRAAVLRGMCMNHLIHHRGQLTVYLRALGVSFPGVYGPSADDPNPFASAAPNA